ncbi:polyketide synthase [Corallococcus coralloides]|uniref:CorK n=1 Tax=Corallococcus coralloides TaxID=184914 RepID=D7RK23_CORCK|nr:SDR family NAD(P)-dependent oxidoreductase [Corallococcus coralloides]ADI59533.1 CorK [Corallococcus coralloides]QAT84741.1 polyketide synthase [Corallococcus coralloides]
MGSREQAPGVAIIGMACRFPLADDVRAFWDNLAAGRDCIREIPPSRWDTRKFYSPDIDRPGTSVSRWCGLVDGVERFDHRFFEISPREAKNMDPQQRLLMEETLHCIEDSGVPLSELRAKRTSVFAGVMATDYHQEAVHPDVQADSFAGTGNYVCILANRLSYAFGLQGKSFTIDAACASSLVALHEARCSLERGESDYALVAGVSLNLHPWKYVTWSKSRMLSPRGRCSTFDKDADGYVPGDGVGVLLLQRRDDARRDRNRIHGVVKGSAVNHGGRTASMTAPRIDAQRDVILAAIASAGISARSIGYVEAHGTGTSLGDPIEVEALTRAFRQSTQDVQFAKLGSVKTNIGHLEAAAGVAGVIKVLLMMRHGQVPRSLNVTTLNPIIDFPQTPFSVALEPSDWPRPGKGEPRRAGVSSFGIGGANSHVVLEEHLEDAAEPARPARDAGRKHLFLLSAKSPGSFARRAEQWREWLRQNGLEDAALGDVCVTNAVASAHHPLRRGALVGSTEELRAFLDGAGRTAVVASTAPTTLSLREHTVTGFRSVRPLYESNALFRDRVDALLKACTVPGLRGGLATAFRAASWSRKARPVLSCLVRYAFWATLGDLGFQPREVHGGQHGFAVALALSGMLPPEEALGLVSGAEVGMAHVRSPAMGVFDPVVRRLIPPVSIRPEYLAHLVADVALPDEALAACVTRARQLFHGQRTFQRFLEEWDGALAPLGFTMEHFLHDPRVSGRHRLLLFVAVESAFRKLSTKWSFQSRPLAPDARLTELIGLVAEGVVSRPAAVELLVADTPDLVSLARAAQSAAEAAPRLEPHPLLESFAWQPDGAGWLQAALEAPPVPAPSGPHVIEEAALDAAEATDLGELFDRTVLSLWEQGVSITWERLHPAGSYARAPLPPYPFEGEAFWIRDRDASAPPSSTASAPAARLSLSPEDPILRDHVVGGHRLIPGALMMGLSLRAARDAGLGERASLRNVVFHTPGRVSRPVELRAELDGDVSRVSADGVGLSQAEVAREGEGSARPDAPLATDGLYTVQDVNRLYAGLASSGFQYGESLRLLRRFGGGEAACFAELSTAGLREQGDALLPHVLDTVLQAGLLTGYVGGPLVFGKDRFVPAFVGALRCFGTLPPVLRLLVERKPEKGGEHRFHVDIIGQDARGQRVLELHEVVYQRADAAPPARSAAGWEMKAPYWRELPLPAAHATASQAAVIGARVQAFVERARRVHGAVQAVSPDGDVGALVESLTRAPGAATLYFLGAWEFSGLPDAERALRTLFHLVKAHLSRASDRELRIVVAVRDAFVATPEDRGSGFAAAALLGLAKTAMRESPRLQVVLVDVDLSNDAGVDALLREGTAGQASEEPVAWRHGRRLVRELRPVPVDGAGAENPFRAGKNYLLVGGGGGIGRALLDALASRVACRVFVLGRSERAPLDGLASRACELHFLRCDVTDGAQVDGVVRRITRDFGPLHGVLHLGGVLSDRLLMAKSWEDFQRVLAPKLAGTLNLHQATLAQPLDFFVGFSSIVALTGNVGQADYAAGNSFLDAFMAFRDRSGAPGLSRVVNWPLWEGVGMAQGLTGELRHLRPIAAAEGVKAFTAALSQREHAQVLVQGQEAPAAPARPARAEGVRKRDVEGYLRDLIAARLGLPGPGFDATESFFTMGLDSLILQELMAELNRTFRELPPTLLFEHPNLQKLVAWFEKEGLSGPAEPEAPAATPALPEPARAAPVRQGYDIAIIGMSGRFPLARTVPEFWRNLVDGVDCIQEIPPERWDANAIQGSRSDVGARSYGRWGGFIEDVDRFDPLFFNVSPKEAEEMDPQQRLFLECVWETLEDAGYAARKRYAHQSVGLFVGSMWNEYSLLAHEQGLLQGDYKGPGSLSWAIANRVSFFMDFKGPSLAVDTACSSSLVSIHLACQSLLTGECDMAVAGGVNLSIHPGKYVYLSQAKFLSSDGRCRSFGEGGDGYVPGEGVGAVLLKPLAAALADGDRIHAVIRGSASNHGGKAAGFTVPNPEQHARLIQKSMARAAVGPEDIGYVECHGTGTSLGDPIEIRGLQLAFGEQRGREHPCPIGSVKSNIGHLEAAAGIAAVIKVALAMRHRVLPRSLHGDVENPKLDLAQTPFQVVKQTRGWDVPAGRTRIAAISSFGAGGSNAHLVLEEFPRAEAVRDETPVPRLFVFSARDAERLEAQVARLRDFLDTEEGRACPLSDVAHTLQVGRQAFNTRWTVVARDRDSLRAALAAYPREAMPGEDARSVELARLAETWRQGGSVDWARASDGVPGRIVSLPTYPFRRERFWIDGPAPRPPALTQMVSEQEPLLADHVLHGEPTLPGVFMLAKLLATEGVTGPGTRARRIRSAVWTRPLRVRGSAAVELSLEPKEDRIRFGLWSGTGQERRCYAEGSMLAGDAAPVRPLDLLAVRERCPALKTGAACYTAFTALGLRYGARFQRVGQVSLGAGEALARLELDPRERGEAAWVSLLDGALQSALALLLHTGHATEAHVPFSLGALDVLGEAGPEPHAHVRMGEASRGGFRFDIDLTDGTGRVFATLRDVFLGRMAAPKAAAGTGAQAPATDGDVFQGSMAAPEVEAGTGPYFYRPEWHETPLPAARAPTAGDVLVLGADASLVSALRAELLAAGEGARLVPVALAGGAQDGLSVDAEDPASYQALVDALVRDGVRPTRILQVASLRPDVAHGLSLDERIAASGLSLLLLFQALIQARAAPQVSLVYAYPTGTDASPVLAAPGGLLRTLVREKSGLFCASVGLEALPARQTAAVLWQELSSVSPGCSDVAYDGGLRLTRRWASVEAPVSASPALRRGGVHLITGGAGGLGLLFAEHLVRHHDARVVLTGRSALDAAKQVRLSRLGDASRVLYLQGDVSRAEDVTAWVRTAREHFGALHVVLHGAGVRRDAFLLKKTRRELDEVLRPKLLGAMHLDAATRDVPLDAFVLFSSVSAVLGNTGQGDYAYANAFLDAFAWQREARRQRGERSGQTVSLDWPLWRDGGMTVDPASEALLATTMGLRPLLRDEGLKAFERALTFRESQLMVIAGNKDRIDGLLGAQAPARRAEAPAEDAAGQVLADMAGIMSRLLRVNRRDIHPNEDLREYGFDSITFTQFANALNEHFRTELSPAIFFEHSTLASLAAHVASLRPAAPVAPPTPAEPRRAPAMTGPVATAATGMPPIAAAAARTELAPDAIAIIGVSGVMPRSENLEQFWKHLEAGEDLVTGIPEQRWDWWKKAYGQAVPGLLEAMRGKRGGFIPHPEHFDAEFFGISAREADFMDPQQRIFLRTLWQSVEDAGYRMSDWWGARVGLFVGVATSDYTELLRAHNAPIDGLTSTGVFHSILVNRISYLFNFTGPSEPVDTACSSSLVAVQRAVAALRDGQCDVAIAGGVNLLLAPTLFLAFDKAGMLSPDGRCKTFDKDANGYVRGEGCAAVVLKPLRKALEDGDTIRGIVRAAVVGHAGRANSLTAPNPNAQADLLVRAYREAGIPPSRVSYIEAHGTGTSLGDPIEVNALKKAFRQLSGDAPATDARCALGAVKTNAGHLEAAAGMAGLVKVLLALKHRKVPANAHFRERNPYVDLDGSPFYLPGSLQAWESPRGPRVAGLSSFGFGGVNAHLVIEEHVEPAAPRQEDAEPGVFVLSARTEAVLRRYAADLLQDLEARGSAVALQDVAYTTQVGREAMAVRLAVIASNRQELFAKLRAFTSGAPETEGVFLGRKAEHGAAVGLLIEGEEGALYLRTLARNGRLPKLCQLWTLGVDVDWRLLHEGRTRRRVPLPTYPFVEEAHWYDLHVPMPTAANRPVMETAAPPVQAPPPAPVMPVAAEAQVARPGKLTLRPPVAGEVVKPVPPVPVAAAPADPSSAALPAVERLRTLLAQVLFVDASAVGVNEPLSDLGLDPVLADEFFRKVNEAFGTSLRTAHYQGDQTLTALARGLDVKAPPATPPAPAPAAPAVGPSIPETLKVLRSLLAGVLFTEPEAIEASRPLVELGLDSVLGIEFMDKVNQRFAIKVSPSKVYEHPSLERLGAYIAQAAAAAGAPEPRQDKHLFFAVSESSRSSNGAGES